MFFDSLRSFFPQESSRHNGDHEKSSQSILDAINMSEQKRMFTQLIMLDLKERKKGEVYYKGYTLTTEDIESVLHRFPTAEQYRRFTLELSFNIGSHEITNMSYKLIFRNGFDALGKFLYPAQWENVIEKPRKRRRKDAFKQSKKYRDTGRLDSKLRDGFIDVGRGGMLTTESTETSSENREILIVDRTEDIGLQEVLADARKIVEKTSDKSEALFLIAKLVFNLMNGEEGIEKWIEQNGKFANTEVFIGDFDQRYNSAGVCRHMALLFHIVASDFGFRTALVRGYYRYSNIEEAHTWCELNLNGKRFVVDLAGDPSRYQKDFAHFQQSGGFPESNSDALLANTYTRKKYFDINGKLHYSIG